MFVTVTVTGELSVPVCCVENVTVAGTSSIWGAAAVIAVSSGICQIPRPYVPTRSSPTRPSPVGIAAAASNSIAGAFGSSVPYTPPAIRTRTSRNLRGHVKRPCRLPRTPCSRHSVHHRAVHRRIRQVRRDIQPMPTTIARPIKMRRSHTVGREPHDRRVDRLAGGIVRVNRKRRNIERSRVEQTRVRLVVGHRAMSRVRPHRRIPARFAADVVNTCPPSALPPSSAPASPAYSTVEPRFAKFAELPVGPPAPSDRTTGKVAEQAEAVGPPNGLLIAFELDPKRPELAVPRQARHVPMTSASLAAGSSSTAYGLQSHHSQPAPRRSWA